MYVLSASVVVPGVVIPGARTYNGTRMISSYTNGPLLRRPWEPHMSPWSDVKTTAVSSARPEAPSASRIAPRFLSPS